MFCSVIHSLFESVLSLLSFEHKFDLSKPGSYDKKVVKKLASDGSMVRSEPGEK